MNATRTDFHHGRHAGLLLPLFSVPSRQSWGIGEFGDLPALCSWLGEAGLDFVQVLPLNEMTAGQHSPYAAVSAMALDPIFISLSAVEDFAALGGEASLGAAERDRLAAVRATSRIDYNTVRELQRRALRAAFARFVDAEWRHDSPRARALRDFVERERWWLEDYVLFRAEREHRAEQAWWTWPAGLAARNAFALAWIRDTRRDECLFFVYLQWIANGQWREARDRCLPVGVFGDMPFVVGADSADVWGNQHAFRFDATVGAPPDAFSETGQNWGLPVYRWEVFEAEQDAWIRARARRNAELYDGYRVDHLVGFYRTYVIPKDGSERTFSPADEAEQLAQGERLLSVFAEPGARIIAEDLGTVPEAVRASLARLGVPGFKVLRWERDWSQPGHPFADPLGYPTVSVATTGTHDTETLVEWWESASRDDRHALVAIPFLQGRALDVDLVSCSPEARLALLELIVASTSDFVILPMQDVFGWRDRVNVPATVSDDNWTWRLPWPVDEIRAQPEARDLARTLRAWMRTYERSRALFRRHDDR